jgi:hypothetical protein
MIKESLRATAERIRIATGVVNTAIEICEESIHRDQNTIGGYEALSNMFRKVGIPFQKNGRLHSHFQKEYPLAPKYTSSIQRKPMPSTSKLPDDAADCTKNKAAVVPRLGRKVIDSPGSSDGQPNSGSSSGTSTPSEFRHQFGGSNDEDEDDGDEEDSGDEDSSNEESGDEDWEHEIPDDEE